MKQNMRWRYAMAKDAMIRARTDGELKCEVEDIFRELGLTATEAINIFYRQVKINQGLPFLVRIPNALTRKTLEKSARGEDVHTYKSSEEMFRKLGI
jgi:DNA-damage-inducible protein J